eukprot:3264342-Pyramimonas_sp.AAC.1
MSSPTPRGVPKRALPNGVLPVRMNLASSYSRCVHPPTARHSALLCATYMYHMNVPSGMLSWRN